MTVTAVGNGDFATRQSVDIAPRGLGYEHVRDAKLAENAAKWADEAVQKLTAKSVDVGRYDLVLHPSHLWLTIHESVAHPTELDRAMGYEANYAGTSFVAPPGEGARNPQVRIGVDEHSRRPIASGIAVRLRLGRRRRQTRGVRHHQEGHLRGLPHHARAGAVARLVLQEARQADPVAWVLVRANVGRGAIPADAQRFAVARRQGTGLGRSHRRNG
jgi:hypothetical protein